MPAELHAVHTLLPTHPDAACAIVADALVDAADRRPCDVRVARVGDMWHVTGQYPEGVDLARTVGGEVLAHVLPEATRPHVVATGHAVDEPGTNYLPAAYWLARHLALRLPAGGDLVVLLEVDVHATRLAGFSCALVEPTGSVQKAVRLLLQDELSHLARRVPGFDARLPESIAVHPFVPPTTASSGPGVNGKDLGHPARAGAILARRLAKAVVRAGVVRECHATVTLVPGQDEAMIVALHGDGQRLDPARWGELVDRSCRKLAASCAGVTLAEVARAGECLREEWPWEVVRFG